MNIGWFDYVFCCLSEEQRKTLETATDSIDIEFVRQTQEHLTKEKNGYRCGKCGKFYPDVQLFYRDTQTDLRRYARLPDKAFKYKKAADVFFGQHYYAQNANKLLKFEVDAEHNARQTDSIPIRRDVYHIIASPDEKYIATETFSGTINVFDTQTKLPVARRQRTKINGAFIFTQDHRLMYFFKDAIRCWDFIRNQDTILFRIPELWKRGANPRDTFTFICTDIIYNRSEDAYLFVCITRMKTYVVTIRDGKYAQVVQLPRTPAFVHLVFAEDVNQYTFSDGNDVLIYDADFRVVEQFAPPQLIELCGGDKFPISYHRRLSGPHRTFISPDGKRLLLDYFTTIVLMGREDREIKFCLSSHNGGLLGHMGFLNSRHFWYTKGDSTYVQPIET